MRAAAIAICAVCLAACSAPEQPSPRVCPSFEPIARDPLSIEAAREAHRWSALRRRIRHEEARSPGYLLRLVDARVPSDGATDENVCFADLYIAGRLLFEHEFAHEDGLGNELGAVRARNPFRRVQAGHFGGPETNGCRSCHWRGGRAGAGDLPDDALVLGDGDAETSADARNPPALHGDGVLEALAREMSTELAALRASAIERAAREGRDVEIALEVQGVDFGVMRAGPDASVDASGVVGIDADLVVRPFGWKGTFATIREISAVAFQVHVGLQADALIADNAGDTELLGDGPPEDPDRDARRELDDGHLDAVTAFLAAQAVPIMRPHERIDDLAAAASGLVAPTSTIFLDEWAEGRVLFDELGCAACHVPRMVLRDPIVRIGDGGAFAIDLSAQTEAPRVAYDPTAEGYPVFLFSDLRRHDMGAPNESRHEDRGVGRRFFLTRPLWGLADSAPYFHDGRSPSLDHAIGRHDGEARAARDAFEALPPAQRGSLRVFLVSLRRQWRPQVP